MCVEIKYRNNISRPEAAYTGRSPTYKMTMCSIAYISVAFNINSVQKVSATN